jgi:hypothetical protein
LDIGCGGRLAAAIRVEVSVTADQWQRRCALGTAGAENGGHDGPQFGSTDGGKHA